MIDPILNIPIAAKVDEFVDKEWLVTNGLGGYSSGSLAGVNTRRHHGLFIPNLPAPRGRTMMLSLLDEKVGRQDNFLSLGGIEFNGRRLEAPGFSLLKEFRLDWQTPVWVFDIDGKILEKKIFMPYGQNTVYVSYRLLKGEALEMQVNPYCGCRKHDSILGYPVAWPFTTEVQENRYEVSAFEGAPVLRLTLKSSNAAFTAKSQVIKDIFYRQEFARGLDCSENLYSPGSFNFKIKEGEFVFFTASTEPWELLQDDPAGLFEIELQRRKKLISLAKGVENHLMTAQLTLAADQFIILPRTRNQVDALRDTSVERVRTVIAGYHWFTDWGRDTMISLEGLTLCTGRYEEARSILLTFGHYVRNGLLPNHFPEGERTAIYNTVDATFWYFHAIDRYYQWTGDKEILETLYPTLQSIIEHHMRGTEFGIHMDQADGLIKAAADGVQLTWMDAKVDEWVVTPRRGKPVEIQGLWFNALKLMESWSRLLERPAELYMGLSTLVFTSFNQRFWSEKNGYLFDVIDTDKGDDISLRPNQIIAVSLRFPVLDQRLWKTVVDVVENRLLTPYGLRTLDPADKRYYRRYEGNRWDRDAAYHQGLVWTWLIGPFCDAHLKVHGDQHKIKDILKFLETHLTEAGVGSVSEIFDAEDPYVPRACIAQAWSVAETLRCFMNLVSGTQFNHPKKG